MLIVTVEVRDQEALRVRKLVDIAQRILGLESVLNLILYLLGCILVGVRGHLGPRKLVLSVGVVLDEHFVDADGGLFFLSHQLL